MEKRVITSLIAGGLLGAMLPGVAVAQNEGEYSITYNANFTCEFGQGSPLELPPCEFDEGSGVATVTMLNPGATTGVLEGRQVFDGVAELNLADGTFSGRGSMFWSGAVEGCGEGSFFGEGEFAGGPDAGGATNFSVNNYTIVPGGSLPITGTIDATGPEAPNADGSATQTSALTYSCDVTPEDPMAATAWTGRWIGSDGGEVASEPGEDYSDFTGWEDATVEANDARIAGDWQQVITNRVFPGDVVLKSATVRIENDGGAWTGRFDGYAGGQAGNKEWNVLTGEGGYEGLTATFLWSADGSTLEGVIVPGELPPLPDPLEPAAE